MDDGLRRARAAALPAESGIASWFAGSDLADSFAITLPSSGTRDVLVLSRFVLADPAPWFTALLRLRDGIVRLFGVKTTRQLRSASRAGNEDRIDFFRILSVSDSEVIVGEDDRHLDFRASILLRRREAESGDELLMTTAVHCHNLLGRTYLAIILPFHRLIVRSMLNRAARRGWPS
jgi:hypothetical protein